MCMQMLENNHGTWIPLDCKVEDTKGIQIHMPDDFIECLKVAETWTSRYFALHCDCDLKRILRNDFGVIL